MLAVREVREQEGTHALRPDGTAPRRTMHHGSTGFEGGSTGVSLGSEHVPSRASHKMIIFVGICTLHKAPYSRFAGSSHHVHPAPACGQYTYPTQDAVVRPLLCIEMYRPLRQLHVTTGAPLIHTTYSRVYRRHQVNGQAKHSSVKDKYPPPPHVIHNTKNYKTHSTGTGARSTTKFARHPRRQKSGAAANGQSTFLRGSLGTMPPYPPSLPSATAPVGTNAPPPRGRVVCCLSAKAGNKWSTPSPPLPFLPTTPAFSLSPVNLQLLLHSHRDGTL